MKKLGLVIILLLMTALIGMSCDFKIEAATQTINKGDEFYIKITVFQDHTFKCVLPSEAEYKFNSENIKLLGMTEWEEISKNTLQTWLKVKALDYGDGWVKISKNCKKEGYEEKLINFEIK